MCSQATFDATLSQRGYPVHSLIVGLQQCFPVLAKVAMLFHKLSSDVFAFQHAEFLALSMSVDWSVNKSDCFYGS